MTRFFTIILLCLCCLGSSIAQSSLRPADLVADAQRNQSQITANFLTLSTDRDEAVPAEVVNFELFVLDKDAIRQFLNAESGAFVSMSIPTATRSTLNLQLVEVDIDGGTYVTTMPANQSVKVNTGRHYRGVIRGDESSLVAISIFEDEVMGFIAANGQPNLVLGSLEQSDKHILYEDSDLKDQLGFACDTPDSDVEYTEDDLSAVTEGRALSDCVRMYMEVDNDIYVQKGSSVANVTNFVTGLFNQVATMYANEQINIVLSPLTIWTQTSPYSSTSSSGMLNQFLANTGSFDGDLAMLLSYQASGGIAYVNGLCSSNPDYSKSFSSINSTYQNVPTYSWSVMVITHEFGHLFGSQHTHACAWNGNNTAIDGCYTTEGSCPSPSIPSGGGTVMSYCHLTSAGINLNLGFGPQPGNLIRSRVQNASCTQACDGDGGGGGGGGTTCTETEATLTIVTDNYPGETTWTVTDAGGTVLYSGGPYSTQGQTYTADFCLVDGCFDFNIFDSYGDGICCAYGQGSYDITIGGQSVASGGAFGSSEIVNFCSGNNPPPATCNDGIQNGNETGVDCGGSDCAPCNSCNDGIQNGNETGIDCGGSDCAPCVSCNDGVQNNGETDVDCGGPNCSPCETCNDGVQNGSETGIDCGGSDCAPCGNGGGSDEVFAHYFESGWDGWQDGGSDCYRYTGSRSYEGSYSIRIRDNSGTASAMTSSAYDLTAYSGVEVTFYFYPNSMETGEDFWLRYYDGSSWTTVATFVSGSGFNNGTFYVATVPILGNQYTMAPDAQFRFQCDASANADQIYIDAVTVTGVGTGSLPSGDIKISPLNSLASISDQPMFEEIGLAPNPASDRITLSLDLDYDQTVSVEVIDVIGKSVVVQKSNMLKGTNQMPIDISVLSPGTYFIRVTDGDGDTMVDKFIKID